MAEINEVTQEMFEDLSGKVQIDTTPKNFKQSGDGAIVSINSGRRPVFMPSAETEDPHVTALAESIFWSDQMREHAMFIQMLLPIEQLAEHHEQIVMLRGVFENIHERTKNIEISKEKIQNFIEALIPQIDKLVKFKRDLRELQLSAKIHSLVWPLFLDHIAREGERFSARLKMFLNGQVQYDRDDLIKFWSQIMYEHAAFVAHLLDPEENFLFKQSLMANERFREIQANHPLEGNMDPITMDVDGIINFKTVALKGIEQGAIKSIIPPDLADHVRREAVLFGEELKRADRALNVTPKSKAA